MCELECVNCLSDKLIIQEKILQYFAETNLYCVLLKCEECNQEFITFLDVIKVVKSDCA